MNVDCADMKNFPEPIRLAFDLIRGYPCKSAVGYVL